MTRRHSGTDEKWINKLISFFRQMPRRKPDASETDYSGWHQSEEQYRKEQAEWLRQVEERKKKEKPGNENSRK
ncbi:MAG: hypothetical protein ACOCQI_03875 [Desulfosalsimonas sp.]